MTELRFACSICSEPSGDICHWCTKDACANHLCARCQRCSDCCACDVPLEDNHDKAAASNGNEPLLQ